MNKYICTIAIVLLFSCKMQNSNTAKPNQKEQWITAYKKAVIISTLRQSGIDLKNDNSQAILFEVFGTSLNTLKEIDSLGNVYARNILSLPNYFEGKPIITKTLNIYNSKELDSLANASYNDLK